MIKHVNKCIFKKNQSSLNATLKYWDKLLLNLISEYYELNISLFTLVAYKNNTIEDPHLYRFKIIKKLNKYMSTENVCSIIVSIFVSL